MDANANANPIVPPQPIDTLVISHRARVLLLLNIILLASILIITQDRENVICIAATTTALFMLCILMIIPAIFHQLDVTCHPKMMSWIAAFLFSIIGAVYPAFLHLLKPHWLMILGWIMLAIHVLATALQYYDYLLDKGFCHNSVHPFPPGTEENV